MVGNKRLREPKLREMNLEEEEEKANRIRQKQEEQKKVREGYQDLTAKLKDAQSLDLATGDENFFKHILNEADKLSKQAARPREQLQDADILESLSFNLKTEVRRMQQHDGRSPSDFVAALCRTFGRGGLAGGHGGEDEDEDEYEAAGPSEHSFDWTRLGKDHGLRLARPAVSFGTMLGSLNAEAPKGRAIPQQRRRRDVANGAAVTPDEADEQAAQDDQERERETETRVRSLFKAIRKAKPNSGGVPILPLILDAESFTRTVENVFALSFLIKDGRCQLNSGHSDPGAGSLECILAEPKNAPSDEARARGLHENSQFILRLDYNDWVKLRTPAGPSSGIQPVQESQPVSAVL